MRRAMLAVYAAAGLSFLAGVVRDGLLVRLVPDYAAVFGVMYAAALASGFSVNAVTLGRGLTRRGPWALVGLALLLFVLVGLAWQRLDLRTLLLVLPVPVAYVLGAVHSRRLLESGHVLMARVRDGIASAMMAVLVVAGLGMAAFPLAVVLATLLFAVQASRLSPAPPHAHDPAPRSLAQHAANLFYANVAALLINAWALWANPLPGEVWGQPVPVAVRFAMYAFQLLSLPSVLLVRLRPAGVAHLPWRSLTWACLALALAAAAAPLAWSVILFPLACIATLYAAVLSLHAHSGAA